MASWPAHCNETSFLPSVSNLPKAESETTWLILKVQVYHCCCLWLTIQVVSVNMKLILFFDSVGLRNRSKHILQTSKKTLSYQPTRPRRKLRCSGWTTFPKLQAINANDNISPREPCHLPWRLFTWYGSCSFGWVNMKYIQKSESLETSRLLALSKHQTH